MAEAEGQDMHMRRKSSQLLVIDVQEKLAPHVADGGDVIINCGRLLRYARRMDVPITITEHYPQGIGGTVPALLEHAGNDAKRLEKITFSGWREKRIHKRVARLADDDRTQVVVAGMEAHVCVTQTVLDLLDAELDVYLVVDAVGSRRAATRDVAVERMARAGAHLVTQEMVAFEWLERGDAAEIKDVLAVLK